MLAHTRNAGRQRNRLAVHFNGASQLRHSQDEGLDFQAFYQGQSKGVSNLKSLPSVIRKEKVLKRQLEKVALLLRDCRN